MTESEIMARVDGALAEECELDGLDAVDMVIVLESAFGFKLGEEAIRRIRTLGDRHGFVIQKVREREAA